MEGVVVVLRERRIWLGALLGTLSGFSAMGASAKVDHGFGNFTPGHLRVWGGVSLNVVQGNV